MAADEAEFDDVVGPEERALAADLFGADLAESDNDDDEETAAAAPEDADDDADDSAAAAWVDEDDAAVEVSLQPRKLRKLRTAEEAADAREAGDDVSVDGEEYQRRLRAQLRKVVRRQRASFGGGSACDGWASLRRAEQTQQTAAAAEQRLLRTTAPKLSAAAALRPVHIAVAQAPDANRAQPYRGTVTAVAWNPVRRGLLAAASFEARSAAIFAVDGKLNAHVCTADFRDLPVCDAAWTVDGAELVAVGARPHFYVVDAGTGRVARVDRVVGREERAYPRVAVSPDGRLLALYGAGASGEAVLLSAQTKQLVGTVRNAGNMRAAAFSADGSRLLAAGVGGEVFDWDMRTMRCARRWVDEGATKCTALAVSAEDRYVAVGSDSGVVNVYAGSDVSGNASPARPPKPLKALMNLTTPVDRVAFSPDAQLLAMASHDKKDVIRLVHLPSLTVYANWPRANTPLHHVESLAFSPHGGMLAVGNKRGKALCFRLLHWGTI